MKTILAFGDSLTFGHDMATGARHAYEDRWPTVLEQGLGGKARIVIDALNGRTTAFDDYTERTERNGAKLLATTLSANDPLDAVIIMLGTNDLKPFIAGTAKGAAAGMRRLVDIVRTHPFAGKPRERKLLIVSPPHCGPSDEQGGLPAQDRSIAESQKLAGLYRTIADEADAGFFDADGVASVLRVDGVHLDAANTRAIGSALVPVVTELLGLE